jgi:hypothetical protein
MLQLGGEVPVAAGLRAKHLDVGEHMLRQIAPVDVPGIESQKNSSETIGS